ncbi:glycerol-3-phosphate dehydrogenase/oxidase [Isoalcanivorax indicus]|uniref:glycerol-3-phosphate dehydrogenase/oxidase n=1 Tax=Isoalcanivorax indicus TaxID=2202653 RepID=UPI000DBA68EF|nr:glycerol-3-phosphate dehydrogenase/oxidase [Isoalcanivorax indicus]
MPGPRPDLNRLATQRWDLLVIGGGITGAGILHQAAQLGLKVLLVEKHDFAWGTSSRSSKMVHGGLRYLKQGDLRLTRESLQERERLLRALPDLVVRQHCLMPLRRGQFPGRWAMTVALSLYDLLAGVRDHQWLTADVLRARVPGLDMAPLTGAMRYSDAMTDDSRLVLRLLHAATAEGGMAMNYCTALSVTESGDHRQVRVRDADGTEVALEAKAVINATGAWADLLSGAPARVRPQRGSHLFVPAARLPVQDCMTLINPRDQRPVFVFPWEGSTCIGTTDLDHRDDPDREPRATDEEIDYLLALVNGYFPDTHLSRDDIVSTMAGVRPIIASGTGRDPSAERRDHAVWTKDGVVTVSGGKLTTFRVIALDALVETGLLSRRDARQWRRQTPVFRGVAALPAGLGHPLRPWAQGEALHRQVRWMLDNEQVRHLDDLMLRRTRLGLLHADGGEALLEELGPLLCEGLGWDAARLERERTRYRDIHRRAYRP